MPAIILPSGRRFQSDQGETLLDAALRCGITLEHSCRTGRCSTCKGRVLAGSTTALHEEVGLSTQQRDDGWILTCIRRAESDMTLDIQDLGNVTLHPARTWPCRIQALQPLASDVLKVVLRLPPSSQFDYHPGQYVDVIGPAGVRRSYSVANAPTPDKQVELHIRAVPDGALSRYWFEQARVNDLLRLHGPLGTFFLRDVAGLDLVCLATGTGIAPIKAALEGLRRRPQDALPASIRVYWGGRKPADLYWDPGLLDLPLRFVPVLSRPEPAWRGVRGHVQQAFLADQPQLARMAVYACGSDAMIHDARDLLMRSGLREGRFHSDAFVSSAPFIEDRSDRS